MAKILVLGAGGALGRTLVERGRRGKIDLGPAFPGPVEVVGFARTELDVTRFAEVEGVLLHHRPDIVIYAAGLNDLSLCEWNKWEAYLVNRDGAAQAARSCAKAGAALVYVSTDQVFDGVRRSPYREEDPPTPVSVFADTKLAGELAVMSHLPKHLILRTGWLYGSHYRGAVSTLMERLRTEEVVMGSEYATRQPTWVEDFLDGLFALAGKGKAGTWHVAAGGAATDLEVARDLVSLLQPRGSAKAFESSSGRALVSPYSVLDCSKAAAEGIVLPEWDQSLEKYVRSIRGGDTKITR